MESRAVAGLLLALAVAGACTVGGPSPRPRASSPSASAAPPSAAPAPSVAADCAARMLGRLDEPQRVGQLLWVGLRDNKLGADELAAIREQHAGSVWFTELSDAPASEVKGVVDAVQGLSTPAVSAGVRLMIAANQEGGQIDQFHGAGFSPIPSAADQGAEEPSALRADAERWGRELKAVGVNLEVAPVMDTVPPGDDGRNQPIGVLRRGFGHDAAAVAAHGVAFIEGMHAAGEAVTVKHFPGLGRVQGNTDLTADVVDAVTSADDPYLEPFAAGIAAGAEVVMVSTVTYTRIDPDHMAAFSPAVMRDLLRARMSFQGVIAADDLGAAAAVASIPPGVRAVDFVAAGGDLVDIKYASLAAPMAQALLERVGSDAAFHARVDDAALRVLRLKARLGLLPAGCD